MRIISKNIEPSDYGRNIVQPIIGKSTEEILNYFSNVTYPSSNIVNYAEKCLGLTRGVFVRNIKTNDVFRIGYVYLKSNYRKLKSGEKDGLVVKAFIPEIELKIEDLEIIPKNEFFSIKDMTKKLKSLELDYWNKINVIRDTTEKMNLYKNAFNIVSSGKKLPEHTCGGNPCLKGSLGQCDGECASPGA